LPEAGVDLFNGSFSGPTSPGKTTTRDFNPLDGVMASPLLGFEAAIAYSRVQHCEDHIIESRRFATQLLKAAPGDVLNGDEIASINFYSRQCPFLAK
jgi:hypothetical protein